MRSSILLKFLLVLAPIFLAIVLCGSFVAAKILIRDNTGELTARVGSLAARVAIALDINDAYRYRQLANDLIAPLGVDRAIVCVEYRKTGAEDFLAAHPQGLGCKGQSAPFFVDIPVDYDEAYSLGVWFTDAEISAAVKKQVSISAVVLALAFLVTLLSATIGFRLIVSSRLLELHSAIRKAADEFERSKVPTVGNDELTEIIHAYNSLMDREESREQQLQSANEILTRQSRQDPLTGLCNRRYFSELMGEPSSRQPAPGKCDAILLMDLDHFKQINDRCGHLAGDEVLIEVATRLAQAVPAGATVVRWGGEEFLVYLPGLAFTEVESIGAMVLQSIGKTPIETSHSSLSVTTSIGIVRLPFLIENKAMSAEQAVSLADAALYRAKSAGRNRAVSIASQSLPGDAARAIVENDFAQAERDALIKSVDVPGPAMDMAAASYLKKAS
jgi:diguanylate cyclase (GGDEF)-like protein